MYKSGADGVAKKGKTEGKNLGNSGPTVAAKSGKGTKSSKGGKSDADMLSIGRGMAKVAAQKRG